jgi:hypothetical protein
VGKNLKHIQRATGKELAGDVLRNMHRCKLHTRRYLEDNKV